MNVDGSELATQKLLKMTKPSGGIPNFACYLDLEARQAKASLRAKERKERKERKAKVARHHQFVRHRNQPESLPLRLEAEFFSARPPISQEKARRGRTKAKAKTKTKERRKEPGVAWRTNQKRRSQGGNPGTLRLGTQCAEARQTWAKKMT